MVGDTSRVFFQHGDAHRDVEPIQDVLGRWSDEFGQCPDLLAAIGQEGDVLVRLQTLALSTSNSRRFGLLS
jgi:hypothetical protein